MIHETDSDINLDRALDIVTENIATFTTRYALTTDKKEREELKEKIEILNRMKDEIYLNNKNIISKIIKRGIIQYEW